MILVEIENGRKVCEKLDIINGFQVIKGENEPVKNHQETLLDKFEKFENYIVNLKQEKHKLLHKLFMQQQMKEEDKKYDGKEPEAKYEELLEKFVNERNKLQMELIKKKLVINQEKEYTEEWKNKYNALKENIKLTLSNVLECPICYIPMRSKVKLCEYNFII